jgi:hypothetical protein
LKRLLAVYPKNPFGGRRSIVATKTRTTALPILTTNTNMILIPTVDDSHKPWKRAEECFPRDELEYINKILLEIAIEENEEQAKNIEEARNHPRECNTDDHNKNDNSSSSASSLPRARIDFMENINLNKNDRIKKWLNDGEYK